MRSIQARFKLLSKLGLLSDDENEVRKSSPRPIDLVLMPRPCSTLQRLSTSINSFKSIFSSAATATKGQVLTLVKLPNAGGLAVEFEGELLGKVTGAEGAVLARELMTGYFVEKNANSPKVSVKKQIMKVGRGSETLTRAPPFLLEHR